MITEKIYKNTDHINTIAFEEDGVAQSISGASRIKIIVGNNEAVIDSASASANAFDWTTYGSAGRLDLKLGHERDIINLKEGKYRALIIIYDATYPNGLPWDKLMLEVNNA